MSLINTQPASVTDNILKLDVGQSFSMSRLVDHDGAGGLAKIVSNARSKLGSHFTRVLVPIYEVHKQRRYEIETGMMHGSRNNIYAVAVITRVADEDEL